MAEKQWMIVGLGNPGQQYEMTRHNMGFLVVKALARKKGWSFKEDTRFGAWVSRNQRGEAVVHLLMPTTYMNLSGSAVRRYLDYFKIPAEGLIVVADDIALSFGDMRVRPEGTAGGHNGLKSIEEHLGSNRYIRLRMGIGDHRQSAEPHRSLADYVLGDFTREEIAGLEEFIDRGAQVLMRLIEEPIASVMNAVNMKRPTLDASKDKKNESKPPEKGAGEKA